MQRPAKPFTPVRFRLQPPEKQMNISIIGTGYVGLVSAACFADLGHSVLAIDNNKSKIRSLSKGKYNL